MKTASIYKSHGKKKYELSYWSQSNVESYKRFSSKSKAQKFIKKLNNSKPFAQKIA